MKRIPLSRNKFALVDDSDFNALSKYSWYAAKRGRGLFYAVRTLGNQKIYMHREILGLGSKNALDGHHMDGDGLNNQRHNLRAATTSQNIAGHREKSSDASSKYRGVCWDDSRRKWKAATKFHGRVKFIGRFDSEEAAAKAQFLIMEPSMPKRQSVINRSAVKSFALKVSKERRAGKFTRVSENFLTQVEADVEATIRRICSCESLTAPDENQSVFITGEAASRMREKLNAEAASLISRRVMRHPSVGVTLID